MMRLRRLCPAADRDTIRATFHDPAVWESMRQDSLPFGEWEPPAGVTTMGVYENDAYLGCFWMVPVSSCVAAAHVAMLPQGYGRAVDAANLFFDWLWHETPYCMLIAEVEVGNRLAQSLVQKVGMVPCGTRKDAFVRDGVSKHLRLFGRLKEGV